MFGHPVLQTVRHVFLTKQQGLGNRLKNSAKISHKGKQLLLIT